MFISNKLQQKSLVESMCEFQHVLHQSKLGYLIENTTDAEALSADTISETKYNSLKNVLTAYSEHLKHQVITVGNMLATSTKSKMEEITEADGSYGYVFKNELKDNAALIKKLNVMVTESIAYLDKHSYDADQSGIDLLQVKFDLSHISSNLKETLHANDWANVILIELVINREDA